MVAPGPCGKKFTAFGDEDTFYPWREGDTTGTPLDTSVEYWVCGEHDADDILLCKACAVRLGYFW